MCSFSVVLRSQITKNTSPHWHKYFMSGDKISQGNPIKPVACGKVVILVAVFDDNCGSNTIPVDRNVIA